MTDASISDSPIRTSTGSSFFVTLAASWILTIVFIAAASSLLTARDVAERLDAEKIATAQETMGLVATVAANMNGTKPHEFVSKMIETGQFNRIGIYCIKQDVDVEGRPSGIEKHGQRTAISDAAISADTEVLVATDTEITLGRPIYKVDGRLSGAVYIGVERTRFKDVFVSLLTDLAPIFSVVALAGVSIALIMAHKISAPISRLTSSTSKIAMGALDTQIECDGPSEIRRLSNSVSSMVSHLKSNLREINRLAFVDTLTRLPNRADFLNRGNKALSEKRAIPGSMIGILFIDLDGFKLVNDTHGHNMGDKVLAYFGARLNETLRETDGLLNVPQANKEGTNSMPARLGGDEFTVLLTGLACAEGADCVAERILKIVEEPTVIDGISLQLGASIGVAVSEAETADFETLLTEADMAMYDVKRAGKNDFKRVVCAPDLA